MLRKGRRMNIQQIQGNVTQATTWYKWSDDIIIEPDKNARYV